MRCACEANIIVEHHAVGDPRVLDRVASRCSSSPLGRHDDAICIPYYDGILSYLIFLKLCTKFTIPTVQLICPTTRMYTSPKPAKLKKKTVQNAYYKKLFDIIWQKNCLNLVFGCSTNFKTMRRTARYSCNASSTRIHIVSIIEYNSSVGDGTQFIL